MKKYLPLIFILLLSPLLSAQWIYFDTQNTGRLPGNLVSVIKHDSQDNIWIGTNMGITRHSVENGSWTVYQGPEYLRNNFVTDLVEDFNKRIWISTNGGGVSRFHNGNWKQYTTADGLPSNLVKAVAVTTYGRVWVASYSKGLAYFDGDKPKTYEHPALENIFIHDMIALPNSGLALATKFNGILFLGDTTFFTIKKADGLLSNSVSCLSLSNGGLLWAGFELGAQAIDINTKTIQNEPDELQGKAIFCITEDNNGALCFGTHGKIYRDNGNTLDEFIPADTLYSQDFYAMYFDDTNKAWYGTLTQGVFHQNNLVWVNYNINTGLNATNFHDIAEDVNGNIWFLSRYSLVYYDGYSWHELSDIPDWAGYYYYRFCFDSQNNLWLGTSWGLFCRKNGQWIDYSNINNIQLGYITDIEVDANDHIWVLSSNQVFEFYNENWVVHNQQNGFSLEFPKLIELDNSGNVFVSDSEAKMCMYDGDTWRKIPGLADIDFLDNFFVDSKGSIWLSGNSEVYRFRKRQVQLHFSDSWTYDYLFAEDFAGNIYISDKNNPYGIRMFNEEAWNTIPYNYDGNSHEPHTLFCDSKGNVWFTTWEGIYRSEQRELLSTSAMESKQLTLFPNPFKDVLNLNFEDDGIPPSIIQFYTTDGQLIRTEHNISGRSQIQLTTGDWPEGTIICRLIYENQSLTKKILRID